MDTEKKHLFDSPRNVKSLLWLFYASLGVLLVIDFFIHKHPDFPWEAKANFCAAYGFVSCVGLIFIAKLVRRLVQRDEDYYDG